jgi:Na+/H+-dicarboxylate symporter
MSTSIFLLDWHVIITLLGWVTVISGAARVFAPQRATKVGKKFLIYKDFTTAAAAIWLVVGAVLCYFDFRSGVMS